MTSFRKYKAYADIRGGYPGRGRQRTGVVALVDDGNFLAICVATSLETSEIRPAIGLHGDMLPLVCL